MKRVLTTVCCMSIITWMVGYSNEARHVTKVGLVNLISVYNKLHQSISFRSWTMSINLCPVFWPVIEVNGNITLVASLGSAPKEWRSRKPKWESTIECTIPHVPLWIVVWALKTIWHAANGWRWPCEGYSTNLKAVPTCLSDLVRCLYTYWVTTWKTSDRISTHCSKWSYDVVASEQRLTKKPTNLEKNESLNWIMRMLLNAQCSEWWTQVVLQ